MYSNGGPWNVSECLVVSQIQVVTSEVNELVERHMATSNPTDDKLAPFRQQAAIIARKKDSIAEQFSELKTQHNKLLEEINVSRIFQLYIFVYRGSWEEHHTQNTAPG